jgi:hypothetical protein
VPLAMLLSAMNSPKRAEKKRSRDASNKIAERCSISVRISSSSDSLSFAAVAVVDAVDAVDAVDE